MSKYKVKFDYNPQKNPEIEIAISEQEDIHHNIILYNDDENTFDWVIECLVNICKHSTVQAEQCAMLVHYKGKCDVKKGDLKTLRPMCSALLDKGLSAEIV